MERVEAAAALIGLALVAGCWALGSMNMAIGALCGALFASVNFRLLIWSWSSLVADAPALEPEEQEHDNRPVVKRFVIKYAFLFAGLLILVGGLKLNAVGFLFGLGNVIVAASLSPLLTKAERPEPEGS